MFGKFGFKIIRSEKRPKREVFFSLPPTLPKAVVNDIRIAIEKVPEQTGKAYLINIRGTNYWLQKSHVRLGIDRRRVYVADIPEWLVKAKKIPI